MSSDRLTAGSPVPGTDSRPRSNAARPLSALSDRSPPEACREAVLRELPVTGLPAVQRAIGFLLSQQHRDGYWWFTLEANESIGAGFIQLIHFLGEVDREIEQGLVRRILTQQQKDGSWPLFYGGPGDLSVTAECYLSLRLAGLSTGDPALARARSFILAHGGLTKIRIFSRIHFALFGLIPWAASPAMPVWSIFLPTWSGLSIYEFSSWARASIVPLLIILDRKPVKPVSFSLNELFVEPPGKRDFSFPWKNPFFILDRFFKLLEKLPWHPFKKKALDRAVEWTREHIERTEDIYPAMAYAALAMKVAGFPSSDPTLRKAINGLKSFHQREGDQIHQQCCISPVWDTPWVGLALLESGLDPADPALLKAARYLLSKEIREFRGDWRMKNPQGSADGGAAGGWSFEFQNDYFPDVDDTLVILNFLGKVGLPQREKSEVIARNLNWLLSMQSKNGGWAAFDKNNLAGWVNKIPFSDHGACLDPPTPDITGRIVELLVHSGFSKEHPAILKAHRFLKETQEGFGGWRGRWGVNFIHGTWSVFQGLAALGEDFRSPPLRKAVDWLRSIQNPDGGWGESCLSDTVGQYVPLGTSVPSQTAWALMALHAAGEANSPTAERGLQWLVSNETPAGGWDEPFFTGTGFPGHFYLKYHGYRLYFPLLALGKYGDAILREV